MKAVGKGDYVQHVAAGIFVKTDDMIRVCEHSLLSMHVLDVDLDNPMRRGIITLRHPQKLEQQLGGGAEGGKGRGVPVSDNLMKGQVEVKDREHLAM